MSNYKIISRRNPVVFLDVDSKFKNVESVKANQYVIFDLSTRKIYERTPKLIETDKLIPSIIESELFYENGELRLKTDEEKEIDSNKLINDSYFGFKNHLEIYDLTALCLLVPSLASRLEEIKTAQKFGFSKYSDEIIQNPKTLKFRTKVNLFIDNIEIEGFQDLLQLQIPDENNNPVNAVVLHDENPVWKIPVN